MSSATDRIQFVADRGDNRLRLDQAIQRRLRTIVPLSRTRVQNWIDAGLVSVNGVAARRASSHPPEGASVEVVLPAGVERRQRPQPESLELSVVFEDDALLVIDKPAGLVVHPSYKNSSGTLLNAVLARRHSTEPGIVTRLDKHTSGLVLVAIAPGVHRLVQRDSDQGLVRKEYLALVDGVPSAPSGTISQAMARDATDRRRLTASQNGINAITHYEVMATDGHRSLLRCELETGRTHQIRLHLASRGWPIVGDDVYGRKDPDISRQALHAWRLTLPHPHTRAPLVCVAPPPDDMRAAAGQLLEDAGPRLAAAAAQSR